VASVGLHEVRSIAANKKAVTILRDFVMKGSFTKYCSFNQMNYTWFQSEYCCKEQAMKKGHGLQTMPF
jgi:hypothetical protein